MAASRIRAVVGAATAILTISLAPATSFAADDTAKKDMPSYPALMKKAPTEVMAMMDTDKGGYVTREEFIRFYEALFDRLDRDKNSQIGATEFTDAG